ncbi:MAG: hypothetical protein GY847_28240, partial [Proteobacteria bacterium]|nr:hypothetical protein [Pseudomonadota bacterium]
MSNNTPLDANWDAFCRKGPISLRNQRLSVARSLTEEGSVHGYYSDLILDPTLADTDSLYP